MALPSFVARVKTRAAQITSIVNHLRGVPGFTDAFHLRASAGSDIDVSPATGQGFRVLNQAGSPVFEVTEGGTITGVVLDNPVQSDWDEASSVEASYIHNKPTLGTAAAADTGTGEGNVPVLNASGKLPASTYDAGAGGVTAIAEGDGINVSSDSGGTVSVSAEHATSINRGVVELANNAELDAGTDPARVPSVAGTKRMIEEFGGSVAVTQIRTLTVAASDDSVAWQQASASLSDDIYITAVTVHSDATTSSGEAPFVVELATGAVGSESVLVGDLHGYPAYTNRTSDSVPLAERWGLTPPVKLSAGARLVARILDEDAGGYNWVTSEDNEVPSIIVHYYTDADVA